MMDLIQYLERFGIATNYQPGLVAIAGAAMVMVVWMICDRRLAAVGGALAATVAVLGLFVFLYFAASAADATQQNPQPAPVAYNQVADSTTYANAPAFQSEAYANVQPSPPTFAPTPPVVTGYNYYYAAYTPSVRPPLSRTYIFRPQPPRFIYRRH